MKKLSISIRIYIGLVIVLSLLAAINIFLYQGDFIPLQELPAPKYVLALANAAIMLILYGGLGLIGITLSRKLGFADIWDPALSNRQRYLTPALIGSGIGIFFIMADAVLSRFHSLGPLPHPPFPASVVASAVAGIGEELIFRLFFISFWVWLLSFMIFKKRWQNRIFWITTVFSALGFAAGHIPSVMFLHGLNSIDEIPLILLAEIVLLNGTLSLFAAYHFRKYGFLACVGIHFWTDVIWHVVWGLI